MCTYGWFSFWNQLKMYRCWKLKFGVLAAERYSQRIDATERSPKAQTNSSDSRQRDFTESLEEIISTSSDQTRAQGTHRASGPQRPVLLSSRVQHQIALGAQPPRLSRPLINSTQHHIRHSLSGSAWARSWRHKLKHPPPPPPFRGGDSWGERRSDGSSRSEKAAALPSSSPISGSLPCSSWLDLLRQSGEPGEDLLFNLKAEWKCNKSTDL